MKNIILSLTLFTEGKWKTTYYDCLFKTDYKGVPFVIHNIGLGTRENNSLFSYDLTGHYRIK